RAGDLSNRHQVARVDEAGKDCLLQGHVGGAGAEAARGCDVPHEVGAADLGGPRERVADTDPHAEGLVAIDDVVAAATFDGVAAGTAEQDVALAPDRAVER